MSNPNTTIQQYFCRFENSDSLVFDYRRDDKLIEISIKEGDHHESMIVLNRIDAIQIAKDILLTLVGSSFHTVQKTIKSIAIPKPTQDQAIPILSTRAGSINDQSAKDVGSLVKDLADRFKLEHKDLPECILVTFDE